MIIAVVATEPPTIPHSMSPPPVHTEPAAPGRSDSPVSIHKMSGTVATKGMFLLAPIELTLNDEMCVQFTHSLDVLSQSLRTLLESELVAENYPQPSFIRRISYLVLKIEKIITEIVRYLTETPICATKSLINVWSSHGEVKDQLNILWNKIAEQRGQSRPIYSRLYR